MNKTAEERSVAGAKFQDKFKNAMNKEKLMYTSKQPEVIVNPKSNATKNMSKAFGREKNINRYEEHEGKQVGESDMNDHIKMEEVIVQGEDQIECNEGCGRKFREDALEKHQKVCKKIFQSKRKEFDTKKHRTVTKEQTSLAKNAERKEKLQKNLKGKKPTSKAWKKDSDKLRDFISKQKEEMKEIGENDGEEDESIELKDSDKKCLFISGSQINPQQGVRQSQVMRESKDGFSMSEREMEEVKNTQQSQIDIKHGGNLQGSFAMGESAENVNGGVKREESRKTVIIKNESVMRIEESGDVNQGEISADHVDHDKINMMKKSASRSEITVPDNKMLRKSLKRSDIENQGNRMSEQKQSEPNAWDLGNQDIDLTNSMINHTHFKNKDMTNDPSKPLANDSWKHDEEDEAILSNSFDH